MIPLSKTVATLKGCLPTPRNYYGYWFMDMWIDSEPVGYDPLTGHAVYWGDGHEIACLLEENPALVEFEIPF